MHTGIVNRRAFLTSAFALVSWSGAGLAQDVILSESGGSGKPPHAGAGGGQTGAPHGPPEDHHDQEEGHEDEHTDDHTDDHEDGHGEDGAEGDEHESDHATGGKGKGPRYRGGRDGTVAGVSHARSLEDRVLRKAPWP